LTESNQHAARPAASVQRKQPANKATLPQLMINPPHADIAGWSAQNIGTPPLRGRAIEMRRRRRHFKEGAGSVRVKLLDWEVLRVPHQLHHAL
jgi:hypothetical protein